MNGLELPTVLNVDDNEARRYAKSRTLKRAGYQVIESETGAEALRVVKEFQPGLVLLDVKLAEIESSQRLGSEFIVRLAVQRDPTVRSDSNPESSASQPKDPISCRVLIIDDNQVGARAMQLFLQDAGHLVEIARNGVEAFVIARNLRPDVVLCDIALPWMDGYAIARTIRQDAELKNVYLIAISGYAQDEDQQLAKQAGFDEYCVKPVDLKSLDQMIKNRLCARPR